MCAHAAQGPAAGASLAGCLCAVGLGACRGPADKVYYCEAIDKYVSCGRDGTYRLWNGADLRHFKTLSIGSSWITDCIYMPLARKLVFTTVDRAISYYEASRGAFELTGRVYASGAAPHAHAHALRRRSRPSMARCCSRRHGCLHARSRWRKPCGPRTRSEERGGC